MSEPTYTLPVWKLTQKRVSDVSIENAQPTYWACFKGVSSGALGIGGTIQLLAGYHGSDATTRLHIQRFLFSPETVSAATVLTLEVVRFGNTTLPSGGTAGTPIPMDADDVAAASIWQAAPSTPGATEVAMPIHSMRLNYGIIAGSVSDLYRYPIVLDFRNVDDPKQPIIRPRVQEGYALKLTTSAAATIVATCAVEFTEEAP
jgi:hypothetical protein